MEELYREQDVCAHCHKSNNDLLRLSCCHFICQVCLLRKFTNCSMMTFESCIVCKRVIFNSHIIRLKNQHPCRQTLFDIQKDLSKTLQGRSVYFDFDAPHNKTHTQQAIVQLLQTKHGEYSLSPFAELPTFTNYGEIDNVVVYQTFFPPTSVLKKILDCFSYHRVIPVNLFILYTDPSFMEEWKYNVEH